MVRSQLWVLALLVLDTACGARSEFIGPQSTSSSDVVSPDAIDRTDVRADVPALAEQHSCAVRGTPGCGLVEVSGGTFQMGDNDTASGAYSAAPVVTVTVGAFAMDAFEVTVARFRAFWDAGHPAPGGAVAYRVGSIAWAGSVVEPVSAGCAGSSWMVAGRESHPIQCVDWWTALAFCAWDGGRLPTESEWEYASRAFGGGTIRTYPWGEAAPSARCDLAQWNNCPGDDGASTRRVGSFAPTNGLYDLAGNVWEWTADNLMTRHDDAACNRTGASNPLCNSSATGTRTVRGGSWFDNGARVLRSASRSDLTPLYRYDYIGFRCARTR